MQTIHRNTGDNTPSQDRAMEDLGLITAFLGGEERAFTRLVEWYEPSLLKLACWIIGDQARAEDVVQETFIEVFRHLDSYDRARPFGNWVRKITRNRSLTEAKKLKRNPAIFFAQILRLEQGGKHPLEDVQTRPDEMFHARQLEQIVVQALQEMKPIHREVFLLREQGISYEDIAAIVGCDLGTVKSRLNKARASLAEYLAPHIN